MTPAEHQAVLEWACRQGRFLGGHELLGPMLATPKPVERPSPDGLHLNGEGLNGLKRDAFLLAMRQCGGRPSAVAKRLQVSRSTVFQLSRKYL